jgi:hypothetical protein
MVFNPEVIFQYRTAWVHPPLGNVTPTLGGLLRQAFGEEKTWLQFVPTLLGLLWFPFYWARQRRHWVWEDQAPLLLLASFLTASYGAWVYDLVVLLLPIQQVAVWCARSPERRLAWIAAGLFAAINGAALALNMAESSYPSFIWMTPAILLCYLACRGMLKRRPEVELAGLTVG